MVTVERCLAITLKDINDEMEKQRVRTGLGGITASKLIEAVKKRWLLLGSAEAT